MFHRNNKTIGDDEIKILIPDLIEFHTELQIIDIKYKYLHIKLLQIILVLLLDIFYKIASTLSVVTTLSLVRYILVYNEYNNSCYLL